MEFFMFLWQSDKRDLSDKQDVSCFLIMFLYKSKVQCCKEQYCVGTWTVRSMNQDKLEVVKKEMARVNVDILEISKLKWTGWVNLTQMTIISTTMARIPWKKWRSPHSQQKNLNCSTWMQSQK